MISSGATPTSFHKECFAELELSLTTGLKTRIYSLKLSHKFTSRLAACRLLGPLRLALFQITLDSIMCHEESTSFHCRIVFFSIHAKVASFPGVNFSVTGAATTTRLGTDISVWFGYSRNYMRNRTAVHTAAVLPKNLSADRLDLAEPTTETSTSGDEKNFLIVLLSARYQKACTLLGCNNLAVIIAHCLIIGKIKRTKPWCKPTRYCEEGIISLTRTPKGREWNLAPSPWLWTVTIGFFASIQKS